MFEKIFTDDSGNPSSMRWAVFAIIFVVLFNWTYFNVTQSQFANLSFPDISLIVGALGAKTWQKSVETKGK